MLVTRSYFWDDWPAHPKIEVQAVLNGVWGDVTDDVSAGLRAQYGVQSGAPLDLVAPAGSMTFRLLNNRANSAGIDSYYTPGHPNVRDGFRIGTRIRFKYEGVTRFIGWLDGVAVDPDIRSGRYASCTVTDIMEEFSREKPFVPVQVEKRADEIVTTIIDAMTRQSTATDFDVCDSVLPFAPDNAQQQPAMTELQRLMQSEFGRLYPLGDGTLRIESRSARLAPSPIATFDADDPGTVFSPSGLKASIQRSDIRNLVRATYHRRRSGATDDEVLFQHQGTPSVPPGATITITGGYKDPDQRAAKVAGTDMRAPVAGTDYLINAQADGGGADLTTDFSVVAFLDSNSVRVIITSASAFTGFITLLRARGRGLYDYDPVVVEAADEASINPDDGVGESPLDIDMPYQTDPIIALAVAEYVRNVLSLESPSEASLEYQAYDAESASMAMALQPGDPVAVLESHTGISTVYFINGVSFSFDGPHPTFRWPLQRALVDEIGQLDVSALDVDAVLGPL
jgi:hypothetical protein